MKLQCAAMSDIGRRRQDNEDNWVSAPDIGLFIVSDGMGGRLAGGLASQIVVETLPLQLRNKLQAKPPISSSELQPIIKAAITDLSHKINSEGKNQASTAGLGATLVLIMLHQSTVFLAHVGDSRAYLLRKDELMRMTQDHSIVQLLFDMGEITAEQAAQHPARGQISRYLGMDGEPLPEIQQVGLLPGDRWLLCSDGLTNMVDDHTIEEIITSDLNLQAQCKSLVHAANEAGGRDNITVLLVQYQQ